MVVQKKAVGRDIIKESVDRAVNLGYEKWRT